MGIGIDIGIVIVEWSCAAAGAAVTSAAPATSKLNFIDNPLDMEGQHPQRHSGHGEIFHGRYEGHCGAGKSLLLNLEFLT
ncbi:MAG: hypothetical protein ABIP41_03925 [Croceibacterium sp.]